MSHFAIMCELLRMLKGYAGWDNHDFRPTIIYQGQGPMAISSAGAVNWRGLGEFYTREKLMNNSHFALILFVCSCQGLLLSGDYHIRSILDKIKIRNSMRRASIQ
jgi:hypothetical protein